MNVIDWVLECEGERKGLGDAYGWKVALLLQAAEVQLGPPTQREAVVVSI